jgi:hypothetical protein
VTEGIDLPGIVCAVPAQQGAPRSEERLALAQAWAEAAQAECASVPAFLRLAAELTCAGAPPALVRASLVAAEDERRHTRRTAIHAGAVGWLALPADAARPRFRRPSAAALSLLARESFIDGCIAEGSAAAQAAASIRGTRDAQARATHITIAHEEARHAELAWAVLDWALSAGGQRVRDDVMEAAGTVDLEPSTASSPTSSLDEEWLTGMGHLSPRLRATATAQATEAALTRLSRAVAA